MKKKEKEFVRNIQQQWELTVIGVIFTLFAGVAVNALYDLLRTDMSEVTIFLMSGIPLFFIIDILSFIIDNLAEYRKKPHKHGSRFIFEYFKYRYKGITARFAKGDKDN